MIVVTADSGLQGLVQEFWSSLSSATVHSNVLGLKKGNFVGNAALGNQLVVRQCYTELWQLFLSHTAKKGTGMLVTGNPGIGKSWFLFYVLWQARLSNREVVTQNVVIQPGLFHFSANGDVRKGSVDEFASVLLNPNTLFLVDSEKPIATVAAKTLMMSSSKDLYREFEKNVGVDKRYMPTWSWAEIRIAILQGPYSGLSMAQRANVSSLFGIWGGIPRQVLQNVSEPIEVNQAELDGAIAKAPFDVVIRLGGEVDDKEDSSHKILHILSKSPFSSANKRIGFASSYVMNEIVKRDLLLERVSVVIFICSRRSLVGF